MLGEQMNVLKESQSTGCCSLQSEKKVTENNARRGGLETCNPGEFWEPQS